MDYRYCHVSFMCIYFSRYELEKKAALAPKPTTAYRTVRTADGSLVQRPVASVRPMQHGARWIPADVWRRQGMTAQEMTLPLGMFRNE